MLEVVLYGAPHAPYRERMSVSAQSRRTWATAAARSDALSAGLALFALYHLALAVLMAAAPHSFFEAIGPFGTRNDHYVRDAATYNAAFAAGFAIAVRRNAWRVPVLVIAVVQFALHTVNHLVDIGAAHPGWTGYLDFFGLAVATALLLWLLALARARARAPAPASEGDQQ
jgi:hypothetical protein